MTPDQLRAAASAVITTYEAVPPDDPLHKAALALARAYLADEWQPIETAPNDGTRFIGLCGDLAFTCYQSRHNRYSPKGDGAYEVVGEYGLWSRIEGDAVMPCNPTHWKPLDSPPKEQSK